MALKREISKLKSYPLLHGHTQQLMLFVSLAVILIVNFQLLFTFFYADDFLHFYQIANWKPHEFIFSSHGGHLYIFRNLIFYWMFKLFGLNAIPFFSIVLMTHLASAYILYEILHLTTNKPLLAAVGTMTWGICPINYATMAWYSAYGHILVGFFFLLFLYDLLKIEKGKTIFSLSITIRWSIYLLLMATSFGVGLAIVCMAPIAVIIVLWKYDNKWKIAASMIPVILLILFLFIFKDTIFFFLSGEDQNTKPVALSFAFSQYRSILEMFIRVCAYSIYCMAAFPLLFLSSTVPYPTAAIFISIPVVTLFLLCFLQSKNDRFRHYAVLCLFFIGLVGLTAYGRAPNFKNLNISIVAASVTPRYYYVITIVVMTTIVLMADNLLYIFPKIKKIAYGLICILIASSIYPSIHVARIIDPNNQSRSERKLYYDTVSDVIETIRAYAAGSSVFIDNAMNRRFSIFFPSDVDFPGKAAVFSITYPTNTFEGRRVYFVEKDCRVAEKNLEKKNWRISSLLISACNLKKESD
jgi:hypothetical protein